MQITSASLDTFHLIIAIGIGLWETIVIAIVFLLIIGVPIVGTLVLIRFLDKRKERRMKKCVFCAYSVPVEATICGFCRRELVQ